MLAALCSLGLASPSLAATRTVAAGASLQAAIDAAQPGDILLLEAGATFMGPIYLRYKPGQDANPDWITIRTSIPDGQFPQPGTRVTPAHAPLMPKIKSAGSNQPALLTEPRAHHYRLIGIELTTVTGSDYVRELVRLGDGSELQNAMSLVPHHLEVARCYLHAQPTGEMIRAIALNSASTSVVDSHISDIKSSGFDAQAIWGWNGPGPYDIINNFLEASGENAGFGGARPSVPNVIASDIRFLRNHFFKPLAWRGKYLVKNLFELKMAQNILVEGNIFENCWASGQAGVAIMLTVRYDGVPYSTIKNLTIRNNVIKNAGSGLQMTGHEDTGDPTILADNIRLENNLFLNIDPIAFGGDGIFLKIGHVPTRMVVTHNTFFGTNSRVVVLMYGDPAPGFIFTNNIVGPMLYGFHGEKAQGLPGIAMYFPSSTIKNNVFGFAAMDLSSMIPSGNTVILNNQVASLFRSPSTGDYRLASNSPYLTGGTDGSSIGVDISGLNASLAGVSKSPDPPKNLRTIPQ